MFRFRSAKAENGVVIDEIDGMTPEQVRLLAERGVVFCTSFKASGKTFGGNIIAASEKDADRIAEDRGLGEQIVGSMVA